MKDICVALIVFVTLSFSFFYVRKIRRDPKKTPALSTWIIFLIATTLSLITYAISEKSDFRSGIVNLADVFQTGLVLIAVLIWGKRDVRLTKFEIWFLAAIGAIVAYGVISGDALNSNWLAQFMIGLGYFPTIQKMVEKKRNTESFVPWSFAIANGTIGLYPASVDGNLPSLIYAIRTIVMVSGMMMLMAYYEYIYKPKKNT